MRTDFKLKKGETTLTGVNEVSLSIIPGMGACGAKRTYLHIRGENGCIGTLSGPGTLENLAVNILKALKSKRLKP